MPPSPSSSDACARVSTAEEDTLGEPSVLEVEEAAFQAWPADEVVELCGWRLRFV